MRVQYVLLRREGVSRQEEEWYGCSGKYTQFVVALGKLQSGSKEVMVGRTGRIRVIIMKEDMLLCREGFRRRQIIDIRWSYCGSSKS